MFRVRKKMCNDCLFSKNKLVSDERKKQIIQESLEDNVFFTCHKSQITGGDKVSSCCRGFWDKHKRDSATLRLAQAMNKVEYIDEKTTNK